MVLNHQGKARRRGGEHLVLVGEKAMDKNERMKTDEDHDQDEKIEIDEEEKAMRPGQGREEKV